MHGQRDSSVDREGTSCMQREGGVDRREEFGDFLGGQNKNERAFVLFAGVGAPRAECSLHIYWGRMNI